jgi:hypothetical protein
MISLLATARHCLFRSVLLPMSLMSREAALMCMVILRVSEFCQLSGWIKSHLEHRKALICAIAICQVEVRFQIHIFQIRNYITWH